MTSTQDTKEQARQTAGAAADEGKHVAAVVGEEAQNVAGQAKDQVRELMDDAIGQISEQARTQLDRLVGTLRTVGTDFESMASSSSDSGQAASSGGSGLAAQLARQVADRSRSLGNHLDGREPVDVLDDVRRFARQRPAVFLLGALGAGVAVGRLARGAKQAHSQDTPWSRAPQISGTSNGASTSSVTSTAPSYGQPTIAVPPTPVEPTYPGTGGQGAPHLGHPGGEDPSGTGPQGYLP